MTDLIFLKTVQVLTKIATTLRMTYEEINVIVWYYIIPASWLFMINYTLLFIYSAFCLGILVACKSFQYYSRKLFEKSATFLSIAGNILRIGYEASSIVFCLILPAGVYILLYLIL